MIVGIDFGTVNSSVSYIDDDLKPQIIVNERGVRLTPSVVYFKNSEEVIVGEIAKSQRLVKPEQTILLVKRKIGEDYKYNIFECEYFPPEIASFIFRKLKQYTSDYLNKEINRAVITVPAYFDDNQRQGVLLAAKLAGMEVVKLLNEPTAAALAYNLDPTIDQNVLVLDFGGGTFDLTLLNSHNGIYKVLSTKGNTNLGGIDFDKVIVNWILDTIKKKDGIDLSNDTVALQQIWNAAEKAKIDLSSVEETNIVIPYIAINENGPYHINITLTRGRFENLSIDLLLKAKKLILEVLKDANLTPDQIDKVILAGGTSRIPAFKKIIKNIFEKSEILGTINPDEVVALGAAVQAGIIEGKLQNIELKDIVSHTLGILNDDGQFVPIIEKGTSYPTSSTKMFTNTRDNQNSVIIKVLQEHNDNLIELGNLEYVSEFYWKKEEANISVTFYIDINGVLKVIAEDLDHGNKKELNLKNPFLELRNINIEEKKKFLEKINVL